MAESAWQTAWGILPTGALDKTDQLAQVVMKFLLVMSLVAILFDSAWGL